MLYPICTAFSSLFFAKCSVRCFSGLFRVLSCKCVSVFVFMHARHTLLSLCICSDFQENLLNNGSKDQNLCLLVEYVTDWTNLGTGVGLSINNRSCLAQRDEMHCFFRRINVVKMYAMETISEKRRISALRHFSKHSDRISGSKVITYLRTKVILGSCLGLWELMKNEERKKNPIHFQCWCIEKK